MKYRHPDSLFSIQRNKSDHQKQGTNTFNRLTSASTRDIELFMNRIYNKFIAAGIPVVIGETGATNKDNTTAREHWAYYMGKQAATYGVPIVIWDNGHNGNSGGECHSWLNRRADAAEMSPFPTVLEALFEGASSVQWGLVK